MVYRGDSLLLCAVPDDSGAIKGWRPLGGTIKHGEYARDTVARNLNEEIRATCTVGPQLAVIENIYDHHGMTGHEIFFIFSVSLTDAGLAAGDEFVLADGGSRLTCAWVPLSRFKSGAVQPFPDGLLARL